MLKLLITTLFITYILGDSIALEFLKVTNITISSPNKLHHYHVDFDTPLTPEQQAFVLQSDNQNNGVNFYTQKERKPSETDFDIDGYAYGQRFLLRMDTNVKRLYIAFYTKVPGIVTKSIYIFKTNTRFVEPKENTITEITVDKGFMATFILSRPYAFQLVDFFINSTSTSRMFSARNSLGFVPNELWTYQTENIRIGSNQFKSNETNILFSIESRIKQTFRIRYKLILNYISSDYHGKKIKGIEHFALQRKNTKQTFAVVSKGKELKLYLNHGNNQNIPLPTSSNHQFSGRSIFGISGFWATTIELNNVNEHIRLGIEGGDENQELYIIERFENYQWYSGGNYFPTILNLNGNTQRFNMSVTGFGPFSMKFDVSLQRSSRVILTENRNGNINQLISTDKDFILDVQNIQRGDRFIWTFEGNNTILFRGNSDF